MASKIAITTDAAPPSTGTHSQAIRAGNLVFLTGQTGRDPISGKLEVGLQAQTERMLGNIGAVLGAAGCTPADIVKVTLLMERLEDYKAIDEIYAAWLPARAEVPLPARTAYAGLILPAGAKVMLDVIAAHPG
jgi:2-iminobutanoate/2-iminopropanoate deaminase